MIGPSNTVTCHTATVNLASKVEIIRVIPINVTYALLISIPALSLRINPKGSIHNKLLLSFLYFCRNSSEVFFILFFKNRFMHNSMVIPRGQ